MIDPYSDTWRTIETKIKEMRSGAVADLIGGTSADDYFRGVISACDTILFIGNKDNDPPNVKRLQEYL